jgi:hypothetical protein
VRFGGAPGYRNVADGPFHTGRNIPPTSVTHDSSRHDTLPNHDHTRNSTSFSSHISHISVISSVVTVHGRSNTSITHATTSLAIRQSGRRHPHAPRLFPHSAHACRAFLATSLTCDRRRARIRHPKIATTHSAIAHARSHGRNRAGRPSPWRHAPLRAQADEASRRLGARYISAANCIGVNSIDRSRREAHRCVDSVRLPGLFPTLPPISLTSAP